MHTFSSQKEVEGFRGLGFRGFRVVLGLPETLHALSLPLRVAGCRFEGIRFCLSPVLG